MNIHQLVDEENRLDGLIASQPKLNDGLTAFGYAFVACVSARSEHPNPMRIARDHEASADFQGRVNLTHARDLDGEQFLRMAVDEIAAFQSRGSSTTQGLVTLGYWLLLCPVIGGHVVLWAGMHRRDSRWGKPATAFRGLHTELLDDIEHEGVLLPVARWMWSWFEERTW